MLISTFLSLPRDLFLILNITYRPTPWSLVHGQSYSKATRRISIALVQCLQNKLVFVANLTADCWSFGYRRRGSVQSLNCCEGPSFIITTPHFRSLVNVFPRKLRQLRQIWACCSWMVSIIAVSFWQRWRWRWWWVDEFQCLPRQFLWGKWNKLLTPIPSQSNQNS